MKPRSRLNSILSASDHQRASYGIREDVKPSGTEALPFLRKPIFEHYLIKDLPTRNASPSEEVLADPVEFLVNHHPAASMAFHSDLPQNKLNSTLPV